MARTDDRAISQLRYQGYLRALADCGLPTEEELVIRTGREIGECRACSLLEELEGEVKHTADTITCTVPGNKIITLYIAWR